MKNNKNAEYCRNYRLKHPERFTMSVHKYKLKKGIKVTQKSSSFMNVCFICNKPVPKTFIHTHPLTKEMHHVCIVHKLILGYVKDNTSKLQTMIDYLQSSDKVVQLPQSPQTAQPDDLTTY